MEKEINYYKQPYISTFTKWLKFLIFMKQGIFNGGGWKWNNKRLLCWFHRHEWQLFIRSLECKKVSFYEHQEKIDGYTISFYLQCNNCGASNKFMGDYKAYDEHRVKLLEVKEK